MQHGVCFEIPSYNFIILLSDFFINYAGVILYAAEAATQVALDAIQCLGKCFKCIVIVGCTCMHLHTCTVILCVHVYRSVMHMQCMHVAMHAIFAYPC